MTEIEIKTSQLNELIIGGDTMKARKLFYVDNVMMQRTKNRYTIRYKVIKLNVVYVQQLRQR